MFSFPAFPGKTWPPFRYMLFQFSPKTGLFNPKTEKSRSIHQTKEEKDVIKLNAMRQSERDRQREAERDRETQRRKQRETHKNMGRE